MAKESTQGLNEFNEFMKAYIDAAEVIADIEDPSKKPEDTEKRLRELAFKHLKEHNDTTYTTQDAIEKEQLQANVSAYRSTKQQQARKALGDNLERILEKIDDSKIDMFAHDEEIAKRAGPEYQVLVEQRDKLRQAHAIAEGLEKSFEKVEEKDLGKFIRGLPEELSKETIKPLAQAYAKRKKDEFRGKGIFSYKDLEELEKVFELTVLSGNAGPKKEDFTNAMKSYKEARKEALDKYGRESNPKLIASARKVLTEMFNSRDMDQAMARVYAFVK